MPAQILVFAFGKLKTPGLREAADYYQRNLQTWNRAEEIELKPLRVSDKSAAARAQIQSEEAQILQASWSKRLSARARIYLLDETGRAQPTRQWADQIREDQDRSAPEIAFCIGASLGFSSEIRARAHGVLSLGPQTYSHELARVVLWEQLYRAISVNHGHPYHNEG